MNLYIGDSFNNRIRKVLTATSTPIISTFAGIGGTGTTGDGGTATSAYLNSPRNLAAYGTDIYFTDTNNNRVRSVSISTNIITLRAGSGSTVATGSPTSYSFGDPRGIAIDKCGNVFISLFSPNENVVVVQTAQASILTSSEYVESFCFKSTAIKGTCSSAASGKYITSACVYGSPSSSLGQPTVISSCASALNPTAGNYVFSLCTQGSFTGSPVYKLFFY